MTDGLRLEGAARHKVSKPVQIVPAVQSLRYVQDVLQSNTDDLAARDFHWSEAIAVGSLAFVGRIKKDLGVKAMHREVLQADGTYVLREPAEAYARKFADGGEALRSENTSVWDESAENAGT